MDCQSCKKLKKTISIITISKVQENLGVWSFNLQITDSGFVLNKDKILVILKMEQILTGNTNTLTLFCNHKQSKEGVASIKGSHLSAIQSYL